MANSLRAGIIGFGTMGKNHARVLGDFENVELVVIAESRIEQVPVVGATLVHTVDEAISFGLDFAVVAVPTQLHEPVAIRLAESNVNALIEKPLAHSIESGNRILEAFEKSSAYCGVGHIERFNPAILELKRRLDNYELGEIYQIATRRQSSFPGRILDVGVVSDLATHDIDLVLSISDSSYRRVSAFTSHKTGRDAEDLVSVVARLDSEVIVNHVVNWLSPVKERVTVVTGENGVFLADTLNGDLTYYENGSSRIDWSSLSSFRGMTEGNRISYAFEKREPLKAELEGFLKAIMQPETSDFPGVQAGLEVVGVTEAILQSAATGSTVTL